MTTQNTEELVVDVYKVRWTTVKRESFDTSAFKKALPELAKQFTRASTVRRFSIA
jgi:predicted phage-related endonuclease